MCPVYMCVLGEAGNIRSWKLVHIGTCVSIVPVFGCRDADLHLCKVFGCVCVCTCVEKLRVQSGAPARLSHAKENCGRKRPLIEHDARHLKLKSSATEKPQQAGISLAPLLKSFRDSWDQPLCPAPDPHFPSAPLWASISLHGFRSCVWPTHGGDGQLRLELDEC